METEIELAESDGTLSLLKGKKWRARLIEGNRWGSSGYYDAAVLLKSAKQFKKGTPIFLDHQTASEEQEHPFGSPKDFVGVLASDGVYDNDGVYADIEVAEHQVNLVKGLAPYTGLSIRAKGKQHMGEAQGRTGSIIESISDVKSVDLVIRPGAGGKLVKILESETAVEEQENNEGTNNVDEATLKTLFGSLEEKIAALTEALVPKTSEPVAESEKPEPETVATAAVKLAESGLPSAAFARIMGAYNASEDAKLEDLIESERAYLKESAKPEVVVGGKVDDAKLEESDKKVEADLKESELELHTPNIWKVK